MEESKAAAYYNELTRKGEGAARFKQGLGFSSTTTTRDSSVPTRGSALLGSFVRASSPTKAAEFERQAQLETIQNKLKKKPQPNTSERSERSSRVSRESRRSLSRERVKDRISRRRTRSRSGDRYKYRDRSRRRSRSRSVSDDERRRRRDRSVGKHGKDWTNDRRLGKVGKERNETTDYAKLIEGYDKMSAAERVKAKMKLQLSETAEKDATKGSGWERFDFDKDAPLDDEEIEAVEDDAALVKHIGQSFRYSAVETRREDQIKSAHDEAMFGASSIAPSDTTEDEIQQEDNKKESNETPPATSLLSDTVIAKQQGSWRDRIRKV